MMASTAGEQQQRGSLEESMLGGGYTHTFPKTSVELKVFSHLKLPLCNRAFGRSSSVFTEYPLRKDSPLGVKREETVPIL